MLLLLVQVVLSNWMYLLCQWVRPLCLQGIARSGIVRGIVARRSNGDSGDQLSTNSGVQRRPGLLVGPLGVTREYMAVLCATRQSQCNRRYELCEEETIHHLDCSFEKNERAVVA